MAVRYVLLVLCSLIIAGQASAAAEAEKLKKIDAALGRIDPVLYDYVTVGNKGAEPLTVCVEAVNFCDIKPADIPMEYTTTMTTSVTTTTTTTTTSSNQNTTSQTSMSRALYNQLFSVEGMMLPFQKLTTEVVIKDNEHYEFKHLYNAHADSTQGEFILMLPRLCVMYNEHKEYFGLFDCVRMMHIWRGFAFNKEQQQIVESGSAPTRLERATQYERFPVRLFHFRQFISKHSGYDPAFITACEEYLKPNVWNIRAVGNYDENAFMRQLDDKKAESTANTEPMVL